MNRLTVCRIFGSPWIDDFVAFAIKLVSDIVGFLRGVAAKCYLFEMLTALIVTTVTIARFSGRFDKL